MHQALETKENVKIERETQTLATITIQNYFRMYDKLAGMTGTAETEAEEFGAIYNLDVLAIPTHMPVVRDDRNDLIYKTTREKYNAVVEEISKSHRSGQPTLVGTISVEVSELLSRMLKREGIPHNVLNAKQHKGEAEIVARAGQKGAVTIATNMAGRGTDIKLGEGITDLGGLHIIGTERHESRRIDNQLRGRSGRQGDPGSSKFFLSLQDDLRDLKTLGEGEIHFIKHVLAFFANSEAMINENLASRFYNEILIPESRLFITMQMLNESIHAEMYGLQIEAYVKDQNEKNLLFDAIQNVPCINHKAQCCLLYTSPSPRDLSTSRMPSSS